MIEVTALSKRYGSHLAVNNVSFSIKDGEVVGFLGPNGAGKSTIMNILTGYISLTAGSASVDGYDIVESPQDAKRHIGYLPEIPPLYTDMTVREYLDFMFDLKKVKLPRKPHLDEICKLVMISDVQNRLIKNLSKGYRQRVGIAQALIGNPDTLILDEPTVGLDPKQIIEIRDLISRLGKNHTVILSSHILSEIQAVCDRIIIINGGRLVADGTPDELSKALSADGALEIRVAGPKRDVMKTLSAVPGVESVDDLGSFEKGSYDYRVVPEEKADVRKVVFARLAERNWPILSLRDSTLTLEQIFLRLTSEDAPSLEEEEENKIEEVSVETEEESSLTMVKEENE
ncbi:MAG: ATP-binding cassette domain-containing protein [Acutalibacteraceae bacterium]|nr:ATP-binding cassette domain-containing protein [Clostridia bacterium]MBQ5901098.1 ATP-binding cassette domain-containing protein [Clostridia bacterium]MEE1279170.1 ATP-binding cassette domain-containing protein [Acutalibacteraceae bacterium]